MIEIQQSDKVLSWVGPITKSIDFILLLFMAEKVTRKNQKESVWLGFHKQGKDEAGQPVYFLITYELPIVSARAIPQQVEFFNAHRQLISRAIRQAL